jgi:hypothetical protein
MTARAHNATAATQVLTLPLDSWREGGSRRGVHEGHTSLALLQQSGYKSIRELKTGLYGKNPAAQLGTYLAQESRTQPIGGQVVTKPDASIDWANTATASKRHIVRLLAPPDLTSPDKPLPYQLFPAIQLQEKEGGRSAPLYLWKGPATLHVITAQRGLPPECWVSADPARRC